MTHIKSSGFDADGNALKIDADGNVFEIDMPYVFGLLKKHGFDGCWGIESVPKDGDEMGAARASVALIKKLAAN